RKEEIDTIRNYTQRAREKAKGGRGVGEGKTTRASAPCAGLWSLRYFGGFLSGNDIRISRQEGVGSEPITALPLRSLDTLAANVARGPCEPLTEFVGRRDETA